MTQEVRLWNIGTENQLVEFQQTSLNLESRIEDWLEKDITILDADLLVIGRQVPTDYGKLIDLLCLDPNGETVIVELKRDKTPRDITAQALEYAAWISDLSGERIRNMANSYLGNRGSLEDVFAENFDTELPDSLNEDHSILIVGSAIDSTSERIIQYLSGKYGVNINSATFQYFKSDKGEEFLTRVFLIEPSQVEYSSRTKTSSKRLPNLTYGQLEEVAAQNGVSDLYKSLTDQFSQVLSKSTTRSNISFARNMDGKKNTIMGLVPGESNSDQGVRFQMYTTRWEELLAVDHSELMNLVPEVEEWEPWKGTKGHAGFFSSLNDIAELIQRLNQLS